MNAIKYIPKKDLKSKNPHLIFGTQKKEEYEKWSPETCGACCLKMIGDTLGTTIDVSLYQLTMECLQNRAFEEMADGSIKGIFYAPLVEVGKKYEILGRIERKLGIRKLISVIQNGGIAILSIDKAKVDRNLNGGHLILVHTYIPESKHLLVNDPEPILASEGQNIEVSSQRLDEISNKRGIIYVNPIPQS